MEDLQCDTPAAESVDAASALEAPYDFNGGFYEACDCFTICPCWTGTSPDDEVCTGVFAWSIDAGRIDGVDVAGLCAASVSTHAGHRESALQRVVIFVDEAATPEQARVLVDALSGRLGGPLGELAKLLGELLAAERAAIELRREGRRTYLSIGPRVVAEGVNLVGPNGQATTLSVAQLSEVLGSPAEVGSTSQFRIDMPVHGIVVDVKGRSSMRGTFSYRHVPAAAPLPLP